eukprot:6199376-Pleurochrysis_carterae.AAC.2
MAEAGHKGGAKRLFRTCQQSFEEELCDLVQTGPGFDASDQIVLALTAETTARAAAALDFALPSNYDGTCNPTDGNDGDTVKLVCEKD